MIRPAARALWRIGIGVGGALVLAVGALLLVLPGPGIPVIGLGLGILAFEFEAPRRLLARGRDAFRAWRLARPGAAERAARNAGEQVRTAQSRTARKASALRRNSASSA